MPRLLSKSMIDHQNTIIVIPARMAATRLPGKPLADIHGVPMIVHVWRRAFEAKLGHVLVAAGESEIATIIQAAGGDAIVTQSGLKSGSDRVAAALALRDPDRAFTYVVNLQGDLPTVDPLTIRRCLAGLTNDTVDISTVATEIHSDDDRANPNIVKAIAPIGAGREVAFARDFVRNLGPEHAAPPLAPYRYLCLQTRGAGALRDPAPVDPREGAFTGTVARPRQRHEDCCCAG